MTEVNGARVLYAIACGAGPAAEVEHLIKPALRAGWDVQVIATPTALDFVDSRSLEFLTGRPVLSRHRKPGEPRAPQADAVIVAPATFNTINKWALGITDTYALSVLAETTGLNLPTVVLPFVNTALAVRRPFQQSIGRLRDEGVRILYGPGEFEPHVPGEGGARLNEYPWHLALSEVGPARP